MVCVKVYVKFWRNDMLLSFTNKYIIKLNVYVHIYVNYIKYMYIHIHTDISLNEQPNFGAPDLHLQLPSAQCWFN